MFAKRSRLAAFAPGGGGAWRGSRRNKLRAETRSADYNYLRQRANVYTQMGEPKPRAGYRVIPAVPMALNALRRWKLRCPKSELGLVFPAPLGGVLQHTRTQDRFRKLQEKVEAKLLG